MRTGIALLLGATGLVTGCVVGDTADDHTLATPASRSGAQVFVPGAVINGHAVTLPLREGISHGQPVWYIITEASSSNAAATWNTGRADKLANARNTAAVQKVTLDAGGRIVFPATVDFSPNHVITPSATGFPPLAAAPGAVGEPGYSPLVQLPDGTILNAPQLANASGRADKVLALDTTAKTVTYQLTDGFSQTNAVLYISTDSSDPGAAAIEDVTYAPALNAAPFVDGDGTDSSRAALAAITNGPTGTTNPQRQGLNSALLGEGDPLNLLAWEPGQGRYSPLWDVHLSTWTGGTTPTRLTEFAAAANLGAAGTLTAPDGSRWGASGFIVDCPIIAQP